MYPSLQMQLWEPFVFSQFAFTSHEWLPLLHSSISWKSKQSNEELQRWSWWPWWWWWLMVIIVMLNVAMKMITVMLWDDNVIEIISKKKMLSLRHIHVINLQIIVTLRNIGTAYFLHESVWQIYFLRCKC